MPTTEAPEPEPSAVIHLAVRRDRTERIAIAMRQMARHRACLTEASTELASTAAELRRHRSQMTATAAGLAAVSGRLGRQGERALAIADLARETELAILAGDIGRCEQTAAKLRHLIETGRFDAGRVSDRSVLIAYD